MPCCLWDLGHGTGPGGADILGPEIQSLGSISTAAVIFPRPGDVYTSMAHVMQQQDAETAARLEFRALRREARALCEQTWQLVLAARSRGALQSREARLQVEVFGERRVQVLRLLLRGSDKIDESRLAKLEKMIAAILLSHAYFMNVQPVAQPARAGLRWFARTQSGEVLH